MHKMRLLTLTLATAIAWTMLLASLTLAGPHTAGYYACNANNENQTRYWRYVKKRSDAQEKAFKQAVSNATGGTGCRKVSYPDKEPQDGTKI